MKRAVVFTTAIAISVSALAATPRHTSLLLGYLPVFAGVLGVVVLGVALHYLKPRPQNPESEFELGRDYLRLDRPQPTATGNSIEIAEVFYYPDKKSYLMAPLIHRWVREQEPAVELVRIPFVKEEQHYNYAKAYFTAQALVAADTLHGVLLDAIHLAQRDLDSEDKLAEFFNNQGIDPVAFRETFNASKTLTALKKAQLMVKGYGLDSVPAIIVNGTYLVTEAMAGSQPRLMEILDFLVATKCS